MNKIYPLLFPSDIPSFSNSQDLFKKIYAKSLILIGLPICGFFSIYNLYISRYSTGTMAFLMFLALCLLLHDDIKNPEVQRSSIISEFIFRFLLIIFTIYLWYTVGIEHSLSKIPWIFIIPVLISYSTNFKEAVVWTACIAALLIYFLLFSDLNASDTEIFRLKTRLLFIFMLLTVIAFVTNAILRLSMQKLFENQIELRSTNLELQKSEEKYRQLFNKAPAGIYEFDLVKNKFITVNDVMCAYSGYTAKELLSKSPFDLLTEESEKLYQKRAAALFAGEKIPDNVEYDIIRKDGQKMSVILNIDYTFADEKPKGSRVVVYDVTDRKRLEEELRHARKMETIGTLSGGVAHNFNNLLMGIQGRVSLMSVDLEQAHPHMEHISAINDYIQSSVDLTRQLLGLARGGKYETTPIDLNELMLESAAMFGRTHKEIQIHTKAERLKLITEADRSQIEQVLINLYLNAWQAMPDGGELFLDLSFISLDEANGKSLQIESGGYNKISVTDTGIGMDETTRQRIFDPFFTTKEKDRGTGLGLASAYGIIKNHGGMITVHSIVGQGTTFDIYLPTSEKEVHQKVPPKSKLNKGSGTILLVDDEEMICDVAKAMLEKLGYKVFVARSGQEAVEVVGKKMEDIDLVVLDMVMPGMNGGLTFDRIREIRPEMPVVLSSGYAEDGPATEIMKKGCNGFIQKPFTMFGLSQKVQQILAKVQS